MDYNSGKGVDNRGKAKTVEVETAGGGSGQLRGHRGPVYIAGTNKTAVEKALETTKGTTVGVMDNQGKIVKSSSRKRQGRS